MRTSKLCELLPLSDHLYQYRLVFLGLSQLELGEFDESEQVISLPNRFLEWLSNLDFLSVRSFKAYRKATEVAPDQALAWQVIYLSMGCYPYKFDLQGLAKYYGQQEKWANYVEVLTRLLDFSIKESVDYLYFPSAICESWIDRMRLNAQRPYKRSCKYDAIMGHRLRLVFFVGPNDEAFNRSNS